MYRHVVRAIIATWVAMGVDGASATQDDEARFFGQVRSALSRLRETAPTPRSLRAQLSVGMDRSGSALRAGSQYPLFYFYVRNWLEERYERVEEAMVNFDQTFVVELDSGRAFRQVFGGPTDLNRGIYGVRMATYLNPAVHEDPARGVDHYVLVFSDFEADRELKVLNTLEYLSGVSRALILVSLGGGFSSSSPPIFRVLESAQDVFPNLITVSPANCETGLTDQTESETP